MVTRPPAQGRDAAFSAAARETYRMCEVKKMQNANVSYEMVRSLDEAHTLIEKADASLRAIGYTEHSYQHVTTVLERAAAILTMLDYPERTVELVRIAGYLHDIGNVANRCNHAQMSAMMAYHLLDRLGMPVDEICDVVTAIGNHDESTGLPITPMAAAIIIGDKTDVRRNRVRYPVLRVNDIHDRVNGAVDDADFYLSREEKTITLSLRIDTEQCAVLEYFEIFLNRMLLCQKAAKALGCAFKLLINGALMMG